MSDDDWENFVDNDFEIKKEGKFVDEQTVKVVEEQKEPEVKQTKEAPKKQQKGAKKGKVLEKADDEEDIFGDKKNFKMRNELLASKANQQDVKNFIEDDISEELKKQVEDVKITEPEDYANLGTLLTKKFKDEKVHPTIAVISFLEELVEGISERFTSKDLQVINKKISIKIQEKQKEERNLTKKGPGKKAPTVNVKQQSAKDYEGDVNDLSDEEEQVVEKEQFNEDDDFM